MNRKMTPRDRITEILEQKNITQKDLAKRIGISESQVSRILSGETSTISSDTLIALSKEFNVSTDYLLCLTDISTQKNSDISELGLSEVTVRKLVEGSLNNDVLNRLMEHKDFPFLLKLIQIYFCDTAALGMASRNESMDFLIELLTEYGQENPEYKEEIRHDQDVIRTQKMRPHEAETEKIKEVLFRMMKDIKQDFENQIPASPLIMVESMKDMLKTVPRDKRRSTKRDIVNYVSKQMEKQCRNLDSESLELVRDIAERILTLTKQ